MTKKSSDGTSKQFIACARCKTRKRRCDGQKPSCRGCVNHGWQCEYASVRRTRGRGKEMPARQTKSAETSQQEVSDRKKQLDDASQSLFSIDSSRRVHINRWIPTLPEFLVKHNFQSQLQSIRRDISNAGSFKPLLPQHIATRLIQNSFNDIRASQLFDLPYCLHLLNDQYSASCSDPAGSLPRWAIVNATTALAIRFKTAQGAEDEIAPIASAYFGNATVVMEDVVELSPTLISIQALMCMALFIEHEPQNATYALLVSSAARQLHWLQSTSDSNSEANLRLCNLVNELNAKLFCSMYEENSTNGFT